MIKARLAAPADAASLKRMNAAFNEVEDRTEEEIARNLQHSPEIVVIAESQGSAVGFCCAQVHHSFCYPQPVAEVTEMYVDPGFRGKGAAHKLLSFLEAHLIEIHHVDEMHLLTGLQNRSARRAYEKAGFAVHQELYMVKHLR